MLAKLFAHEEMFDDLSLARESARPIAHQTRKLKPSAKSFKELFEEKKTKRKESYINSIVLYAKIAVRGDTAFALLALRSVQGDDVIAGSDVGNARADALHNSGAFMSQDTGKGVRSSTTLLEVNVRMANSGRRDFNPHLSGFRHVNLDRLQFQRLVDSPRYRRSALNYLSLTSI